MNYYKILYKNKTHHNLVYKEGLNVDPIPFNPTGSCRPGGIYFARKAILAFLYVGPLICKVTLPKDARIYKDPNRIEKWKADKVILGKVEKINAAVIKKLIKEGANVHASDDRALRWASQCGYLDIVKCLIKNGANVHANNNTALQYASYAGHLNIIKCLVKNGANIHAGMDYALHLATTQGHQAIARYLNKTS
jgi:hypothetical protein